MGTLKVKVCGIRDRENMLAIAETGPDYMGFIFYPRSLRFVGEDPDPSLFLDVPEKISPVAVFVNAYMERILDITRRYRIGTVQLHGMEPPELCQAIKQHGLTVIKALSADALDDPRTLEVYSPVADHLLFDTPTRSHGGSGRQFDWSKLEKIHVSGSFFLSGGIGPDDSTRIRELELPGFSAVDINSRFETEPGIKDVNKIAGFIKCLREDGT
jgi:phosphoribosylanthranilate isomerase